MMGLFSLEHLANRTLVPYNGIKTVMFPHPLLNFVLLKTGAHRRSVEIRDEVISVGAYSDGLLMIVIAGIGAYLLYRGFRSWVRKPFTLRSGIGFEMNEEIIEHPAVDMLEEAGYEVVSDKLKVPLTFRVDGELLHSRLFIDYIAVKNGEFYLVRTARERRPVEWTGSGLRRDLLPFLLLYPECAGVLYVDPEQGELKVISLTTDDNEEDESA